MITTSDMKATMINSWGSDLTVVNNARVSFDKVSTVFGDKDKSLINFLARGMSSSDFSNLIHDLDHDGYASGYTINELEHILWEWRRTPTHWAPFANGVGAQFHIKVPIFIARQLDKHQIGFTKSEVSRRYVSEDPEWYLPEFRMAAKNVKQGSQDKIHKWNLNYQMDMTNILEDAQTLYRRMVKEVGIPPEQARAVLPQSMMTEYRLSGSLCGWANLYNQRTDSHAQKEIRLVAEEIGEQMEEIFPVSWKALTDIPE